MEESFGVIDKALSTIEALAESNEPLGPTQLAKMLDMNKSTVYRILQTLCRRGYASRDDDGRYTCGAKLVEVASNYINSLELETEAKPYLVMLYSELGMPVHLGVLDDMNTVYVEKLDLYSGGPDYARIGYKTPAYCSSIGKCLLAALSGEELDKVLYRYRFVAYTPNTITNPQAFKEHLRTVRAQGWAMDNEEYMLGSCCVGAPVYDYRGDAVACVSVSGNKEQFSEEKREILVRKVQQAAGQISRRMGYVAP